jgi:hypothetical protein
MMKKEEREAKSTFWLQQLRECTASGEYLSAYARRQGLDVDEGYRWTRTLRRAGLWPVKQKADRGAASALVARKSAPRFARVRIEPAQRARRTSPLLLQLMLADERQLPRVLRLLEEPS